MNLQTRMLAAVVVPGLLLGCSGPGEPVASLRVTPEQYQLAYPGYAEVTLEFTFLRPLGEVEGSPRVFVHLLDELGRVSRTFDHDLPGGWREGGDLTYGVKLYQSALAPPLAAGSYPLSIGLYDREGHRWPLAVEGEEIDTSEYVVATVDILEPASGFPMFYFSPEWHAIETGNDRQVLGRRWLGERGSLKVGQIGRPGTLWMQVGIPAEAAEGKVLVFSEGATEPAVTIRCDCGAFEATLSGPGSHDLEIPIGAGAADAEGTPSECEIALEPNFYLESKTTLDRDSIALENLAWKD